MHSDQFVCAKCGEAGQYVERRDAIQHSWNWYAWPVTDSAQSPLYWKPVSLPKRVPLTGRTVILEPLDAGKHTSDLFAMVDGHDELWDYMGDGPYADEESLRAALESRQHATDAVFFALIPTSLNRCTGYASFMRMDAANGVIEVGNILMSPAIQRSTAATEAMYLMARHIFDDLGNRRYEWKCNAANEPSRRAALRYGFKFEGIFRQHMIIKGRNRDTAWFSMLDTEWPACKKAFEAWLNPDNFDMHGKQKRTLSDFSASL